MFLLKLLLCHFAVLKTWWVTVWLFVPSLALLVAWLATKNHEVPEKGAWNALGRLWANIGWTVLGAAVATYVIVVLYVFRVQLVPPLSITDAITGAVRAIVLFLNAKYCFFCSILPLLIWGLVAWLVFIVPGRRIAKAKIKLD